MFLNLTNANKKTLSSSVYAIVFALGLRLKQIVEILKGNKEVLEEVKEMQNSMHQRTYSEELFDAEEYNSTKYLSDMSKYMEVIMGEGDESSEIAEAES